MRPWWNVFALVTAELEGAKSGGLKTKLSDIIIITGLALIGSEGNIDIKHAIHVKHCDTDANLSQPWNDSCLTFTNTLCCMYEYMVLVDWQVRRLLSSYASLLFGTLNHSIGHLATSQVS